MFIPLKINNLIFTRHKAPFVIEFQALRRQTNRVDVIVQFDRLFEEQKSDIIEQAALIEVLVRHNFNHIRIDRLKNFVLC